MRLSRGLIVGSILILAGGAVVGCGGGSSQSLPTPTVSAPVIPTSAPLTTQSLVTLSTPAPSAPQQIPVAVPSVAGYSGTIALPVPSNLPAGSSIAETASNSAIVGSNLPTLQDALRATASERTTEAIGQISVLLYYKLTSSTTITFPNGPGITLSVPATSIIPNTSYYLAAYNTLFPSLGWQKGFEGPATVSGMTLTFAGPSPAVPLTFAAQVPVYFGLYAVSSSAATPTPAPSATPAPTPTPIPAFSLFGSSISLLATGATATVPITDTSGYTGSYSATSSSTAVATVSVSGTNVIITAVAAGTATITIGDTQGRTTTLSVTVTTTTLPVQ